MEVPRYTLEGHPLENKSVTDYLGVTIDSQLTFRQHVARVTSRAYGALKTLCSVLARNCKPNGAKV